MSSKPAQFQQWAKGHPGLQSETLTQKKKKESIWLIHTNFYNN